MNYILSASGFDPDLETGPDVIMMMVCKYFRETFSVLLTTSCLLNQGIPLKTLMDGQNSGSSSVDFKACFEKAMKVRAMDFIITREEFICVDILSMMDIRRVIYPPTSPC